MESVNAENTGRDLVVDVAQNSASLHISEEIYVRILGKALTQTTQDLTDLEAAIPLDDFEKVRAIAHRLKGDYDNMRITVLSGLAKEINEIAKTSKDKDLLMKSVSEFSRLFEQLKQKITKPSA